MMNAKEERHLEALKEQAWDLLMSDSRYRIVLINSDGLVMPVTYKKATMGGLLPVPGIPGGADVSNLIQIVVQWPCGTETITYQKVGVQ